MLQFTVHCTVHQITLSTVHHTLLFSVHHIVQRCQSDLLILLGTLLFLRSLQCIEQPTVEGTVHLTVKCTVHWTVEKRQSSWRD